MEPLKLVASSKRKRASCKNKGKIGSRKRHRQEESKKAKDNRQEESKKQKTRQTSKQVARGRKSKDKVQRENRKLQEQASQLQG